jgi:DNA-binding NtrC family response regulator
MIRCTVARRHRMDVQDVTVRGRSPSGHAADVTVRGRSPSGHAADVSVRGRSPSGHAADETRALARSSSLPMGAIVRVVDAPALPKSFALRSGRCVVGAGTAADVVVQNDTVSRSHAELELTPEGVVIRDLGSRNGVFYLGQRVGNMVLAFGSRVRLGTVTLAIDADLESLNKPGSDDDASMVYRNLQGASVSMRHLFVVLRRLEGSLVNVLIEGESGCGKELITRAIHEGSAIAHRPLVVINCGAIASELALSELFGHKRGAFTGAHADRAGAFDAADDGTLFLDEVGELPPDAQPGLLRALESGEVRAVGATESRKVKVRVIAATNRDLEEEVRAGRFRADLYYRLAVVRLTVPPLRERPDDIPLLARHFAANAGLPSLPDDVVASLTSQSWPGNARQLRNAIDAYIAIGALPRTVASEIDLVAAIRRFVDVGKPYAEVKEEFLYHFTKTYLSMLMERTSANQSEAARISGLDRTYLGRMLVKHGVGKT